MAVAMIGRPNVGKSSLFNRLIGRRRALVWNRPGVTRDLLREKWTSSSNEEVELWDLAGLGGDGRSISELSAKEVNEIDVFIHVVDGSEPLTSVDRECYERARELNKPVVVVLNKCDKTSFSEFSNDIFELAPVHVLSISAEQKRGLDDVEELVFKLLKENPRASDASRSDDKTRRVFILGRPNVGKSSLLNQLVGEDVSLVANAPGTTRDHVLGKTDQAGMTWEFLDTAGVRKKPKIYGRKADPVEIFSVEKALHQMKKADYVVFVVEAHVSGQLTTQDRKLLNLVRDKCLPTLIVVNKWDLHRKNWSEKDYKSILKDQLGDLGYLPVLFVSAKTGFQIKKIFQIFRDLDRTFKTIATSKLNKWLQNILETKPPRVSRKGVTADHFRTRTQYLKFYYMVQTTVRPMSFQIFCNAPQAVAEEDRRFFVNHLRASFKLQGIPFRFTFRGKE